MALFYALGIRILVYILPEENTVALLNFYTKAHILKL